MTIATSPARALLSAVAVATLATGITVAEPLVVPTATAQAACQGLYVGATGRAANLERAKRRAREKWRIGARIKYGWQYNNWANAQARGYDQTKKNFVWRVRAKGRPCTG